MAYLTAPYPRHKVLGVHKLGNNLQIWHFAELERCRHLSGSALGPCCAQGIGGCSCPGQRAGLALQPPLAPCLEVKGLRSRADMQVQQHGQAASRRVHAAALPGHCQAHAAPAGSGLQAALPARPRRAGLLGLVLQVLQVRPALLPSGFLAAGA